MRLGRRAVFGLLITLLAVSVALRLFARDGGLAWAESGEILELRLMRVAGAIPVGVALAVSGVLLQSLLRNPLASPYILGLTSGSGLAIDHDSNAACTPTVPSTAPCRRVSRRISRRVRRRVRCILVASPGGPNGASARGFHAVQAAHCRHRPRGSTQRRV